jgi:hypothetical protein
MAASTRWRKVRGRHNVASGCWTRWCGGCPPVRRSCGSASRTSAARSKAESFAAMLRERFGERDDHRARQPGPGHAPGSGRVGRRVPGGGLADHGDGLDLDAYVLRQPRKPPRSSGPGGARRSAGRRPRSWPRSRSCPSGRPSSSRRCPATRRPPPGWRTGSASPAPSAPRHHRRPPAPWSRGPAGSGPPCRPAARNDALAVGADGGRRGRPSALCSGSPCSRPLPP